MSTHGDRLRYSFWGLWSHGRCNGEGGTTMKMRVIRSVALATVVSWALAACATLYVTSDVNAPLIHTVQCHSAAWAGSFSGNSPILTTIANPVNESRLRTAIAAQLATKGVQLVTSNADCLVGYGIGVRDVPNYPYPDGPYGWGWAGGWGWGWYPGGWYGPGPYVYRQGLIAVDLYDARTHQPLWHAYVHQDLFGLSGPKAEQKIDAAVAAIFTKYPS
jgi:hypothetical protein